MRVILDECLPRKLGRFLVGHQVSTVQQAGWAGWVNGQLLVRIAGSYDAFITVDQNLPAQHNIAALPFGIVVLRSRTNQLADLEPLVPQLLTKLRALAPGQLIVVSAETR